MSETDSVKFQCEYCGCKISVGSAHAGKKGRCPKCKNVIIVPTAETKETSNAAALDDLLDRGEGYKLKDVPVPDSQGTSLEQQLYEESESEETEPTDQSKLPWFIDIFLFPLNLEGLASIAVFVILPLLFSLLMMLFARVIRPVFGFGTDRLIGVIGLIFYVTFYGYFFSFILNCVIDSARGARRASHVSLPDEVDIWDFLSKIFLILGCVAISCFPAAIYYIIMRRTDLWFGLLTIYSIFFLPMYLLTGIMWDTYDALNPIHVICSIFKTFFSYCGLLVFFCFILGLNIFVVPMLPLFPLINEIISFYLILVLVHCIGRFYWRCKAKLDWGI